MSRISAVRSTTLTLTRSSRFLQLARRELAVADHGVGAGVPARSRAARRPCRGRCRSPGRASGGAGRSPRAPRSRPSRRARPARPSSSRRPAIDPSVQTPTRTTRSSRSWRYSTSVMSSSSVDRPADPPQRVALLRGRQSTRWSPRGRVVVERRRLVVVPGLGLEEGVVGEIDVVLDRDASWLRGGSCACRHAPTDATSVRSGWIPRRCRCSHAVAAGGDPFAIHCPARRRAPRGRSAAPGRPRSRSTSRRAAGHVDAVRRPARGRRRRARRDHHRAGAGAAGPGLPRAALVHAHRDVPLAPADDELDVDAVGVDRRRRSPAARAAGRRRRGRRRRRPRAGCPCRRAAPASDRSPTVTLVSPRTAGRAHVDGDRRRVAASKVSTLTPSRVADRQRRGGVDALVVDQVAARTPGSRCRTSPRPSRRSCGSP